MRMMNTECMLLMMVMMMMIKSSGHQIFIIVTFKIEFSNISLCFQPFVHVMDTWHLWWYITTTYDGFIIRIFYRLWSNIKIIEFVQFHSSWAIWWWHSHAGISNCEIVNLKLHFVFTINDSVSIRNKSKFEAIIVYLFIQFLFAYNMSWNVN